ncbi:hypothetical protein, partial [Wenyingzhuangia sp. 2_MG-2023]|uniref:hypothetical protein n=1 Tax=Wenyingzhuangia sp. 2_MG-2023 TaxID=3062639 RepID=UPI0026E2DBC5
KGFGLVRVRKGSAPFLPVLILAKTVRHKRKSEWIKNLKMAIWQYQLNIIPKKSILSKFGKIPIKLEINEDAWEKYWENIEDIEDIENLPEPDFEDVKTINWWKNKKLDLKIISSKIDKLVSRADYGKDSLNSIIWKGNSDKNEDNDCYISFDSNTKSINEFEFRTDLRDKEKAKIFLSGMLELCLENELMVYNTNGHLFESKPELIYEDLKKSNAVDFLTEPEKFLDKIAERKEIIKPKKLSLWSKIKAKMK